MIHEVHPDPTIQETLSEQQDNIGQIITEIHRLAKLKLTLIAQQVQEIRQNPLWHEMQVAATEVHQIKEKLFQL